MEEVNKNKTSEIKWSKCYAHQLKPHLVVDGSEEADGKRLSAARFKAPGTRNGCNDHSGEEGELSAQHSQVILTISCSLFLSDAEAKQALDQLQNRKKSDRKKELCSGSAHNSLVYHLLDMITT